MAVMQNLRQGPGYGVGNDTAQAGNGLADAAPVAVEIFDGVGKPDRDDKGNILRIEHDDGSITVSLDGRPVAEETEAERAAEHFANLVDDIEPMELSRIAEDLLRGINDDLESRQEWVEDRATGIRLLGLKIEVPGLQGASDGAPVEGMSKVRHPLLLEAVLRFQANARSELLPTDGPVKVRDDAEYDSLAEQQLANALENDLNHYLTDVAREYYPDTDRMLFMLGFGGTAFKKVYFCPLRNRPVSETVDADDLIVSNMATTLEDAKRVTHRAYMRPSTVKRLQILGVYRDVDLNTPGQSDFDEVQREKASQQGVNQDTFNPEDRDREIYECYCELDIRGFEHRLKGKPTGLEIPYRVTIDKTSREILSIVRNYDEPEEGDANALPEARNNFVKYTFVPGLGFYDIGLLHILGNTTNAVTAAWREMLDSGMYANFPGFLMADTGARQNTNIFRVPPGGGALVKTGGMPLNQAIMPLPYKEPGPAMFNLVENMVETGQRVGGTAELQVGEGRQDAPVGTTMALIDQATKVLNSVHKRLHAAQADEFKLLVRCFREHPESFVAKCKAPTYQWDEATFVQALNDCDLVPQADPNTASHTQRMLKISLIKQLQAQNPNLYDPIAVDTAALQAAGWSNPEQFFTSPDKRGQIPPEVQMQGQLTQAKMKEADAKMIMAQANAAKTQHDMATGNPQATPPDPAKMAEMQMKAQELQIKQADMAFRQRELQDKTNSQHLDAINRRLDRESKERLAAVQLAEEIARNPQALPIINQMISPEMLQRLEENEPGSLPGNGMTSGGM